MRRALLVAVCVLLLPLAGRAADVGTLRVRGSDIGPDGALTRQAADVLGGDGPTYTPLLVIEEPVLRGASRLTARVEAFEVAGQAWLELAAVFPDGRRRTAEALDDEGRRLALHGTAPARPVSLTVPEGPGGATPVRLELAVQMLGPGVVSLSDLRLETGTPPLLAPDGVLGLAAALALAAAVLLVARRRRARRHTTEARAADQASAA
jgi:hypothetical protein